MSTGGRSRKGTLEGAVAGRRQSNGVGARPSRWSERIDVVVAGVRCTIDIGPAELVAGLSLVLPGPVGPQVGAKAELHLSVEASSPTRPERDGPATYRLFDAGRPVTEPCVATDVVQALEHHVRIWVSALAPDCLLVHAGVVVWDGRAIVLPGPSGSGKSTLVLALIEAGADYASDDVAVIDPTGLVWPWPRSLRMRSDDGADLPSTPPSTSGSAPVATTVFARYRPEASGDVRPLGPALTASHLLRNTPCARARGAFAFERCAAVARWTRGFEVDRAEADVAAGHILELATRR